MQLNSCSDRQATTTRPGRPGFATLFALAILATCGSCSSQPSPVDGSRAREALKVALDGWKKGEAHSTFANAIPAMTVQDLDWMDGSRLIEYRVDGEGREAGANLRIPVELTLQDKQGKQIKKKVKYTIGTSPMITVFREIF